MRLFLATLAASFLYAGSASADSPCDRYFVGSKPVKQSLAILGAKGWKSTTSEDKAFITAFVAVMGQSDGDLKDATIISISVPPEAVPDVPDSGQPRLVGFGSADGCTIGSSMVPAAVLDATIAAAIAAMDKAI